MECAILPNNSRARPSARVFKNIIKHSAETYAAQTAHTQQNDKNARKRTKSGRTQRAQQTNKTPVTPITHAAKRHAKTGKG